MTIGENPLAVLTFISAPAVLTNASCVLSFGTGNRYGRAIDRVHELSEMIEKLMDPSEDELSLRIRQLETTEKRALLIVRALHCFYLAIAGFVASTLASLIGALLVSGAVAHGILLSFLLAFAAGVIGVAALMTGALLLTQDTRFSFHVIQDERRFLLERARRRTTAT